MARIYQWSGKKGATYWYVDYALDGRRIRKRVGTNKHLAELALADIRVKLERRELGFQVKDKNLDAFIQEYLQYAKTNKSPASHSRNDIVLRHFRAFIAYFGEAEGFLGLKARGCSDYAEAPSERSDAEPFVV